LELLTVLDVIAQRRVQFRLTFLMRPSDGNQVLSADRHGQDRGR
jgi:hypothetical protein